MSITGDKYGKSLYTGPVHLYGVYRSDSCNIASMDIQCKVEDALNLQSDGGTAGAEDDGRLMLYKDDVNPQQSHQI